MTFDVGLVPFARAAFGAFLRHTYTRVEIDVTDDPEDNSDVLDEVDQTADVACAYQPQETLVQTPQGDVMMDEATILVAWDDPLAAGWVVRDVSDADSNLLLEGDSIVSSVQPYGGLGAQTFKIVRFKRGQTTS